MPESLLFAVLHRDRIPSWIRVMFYVLKPLIPRRLQLFLRRRRCDHIAKKAGARWPIDPDSARPPDGWPGWPEGRKFAVVLTHDVEGPRGVVRVPALMELEKSRGFRSSFNFVGADYDVPESLRRNLAAEGFEIGVHGLHHNGLMYLSRGIFERHARGINARLKEWNAVGFRSPAMHRNFDWMHDLNIRYDSSTFDTDPFEPQPEGVHTIFPYWAVNRDDTRAFVELPYTLVQDFTLFVILRRNDIETWKKKADWIAQQGGMVLLNVHPDYLKFGEGSPRSEEFPARHYVEFLEYLNSNYAGRFWQALPAEVAGYFEKVYPRQQAVPIRAATPARRPLRVCMATYSFYERDNRVRRYAESLVRRGDEVDVISLRKPGHASRDEINGVRVFKIQSRVKNEKRVTTYLFRTLLFLMRSGYLMSLRHLRRRYDLVHVHNIPDTEVFAAAIPRLTGAKVILDIHDIVPEFFESKFGHGHGTCIFNLICWTERAAARFAHHVIVSNDIWRDRLVARSVSPERCSVFLNYPDPTVFRTAVEPESNGGKKVVLYPGSLNHHQGLDIAIEAFAEVLRSLPDAEFHIYGDGPALESLKRQAAELGLQQAVLFKEPVPTEKMGGIMARATCGVVPKRAEGFGNEAFSTKILEFMALGVPVAVSATRIDRFYFDSSVVEFFESGNAARLAECLIRLLSDEAYSKGLSARAGEFVKSLTWDSKEKGYHDLVDRLVRSAPHSTPE